MNLSLANRSIKYGDCDVYFAYMHTGGILMSSWFNDNCLQERRTMANKEVTEIRVRNVMKHIPKSVLTQRQSKIRNTLRSTLSSMKSVLIQLKQSRTDKIIGEKRRKKTGLIIALASAAIVIIGIIAFIIFR